jgi:hypothetical protein
VGLYEERRTDTPPGRDPLGSVQTSLPRIGSFSNKLVPGNVKSPPFGSSNNDSGSGGVAVIPRAYVRPVKQPDPPPMSPKAKEMNDLKSNLSPPLPLIRFNAVNEKHIAAAKTITGERLRSIPNVTTACTVKRSVPLCDPIYSRKIAKWFIKRSFKELNWRQVESYGNHFGAAGSEEQVKPDLLDVLVYESLMYAESAEERHERNVRRVSEETIFQERFEKVTAAALAAKEGLSHSGSAHSSNSALHSLTYSSSGAAPGRASPTLGASVSVAPCYAPSLKFDGEFESGNLEKVVRVIGRETLLSTKAADYYGQQDIVCPGPVDQEYDITLRKDINTEGNIQWYYFSVSAGVPGSATNMTARSSSSSQSSGSLLSSVPPADAAGAGGGTGTPSLPTIGMTAVKYPLRVRFNIVNMQKKDSLYNYGMRPATYSENQLFEEDWVHRGDDVCYYRSGITCVKPGKGRDKKKITLQYQYTLTFTYTFEQPDTVYFAHTFPYTYSDLQLSLCRMEQKFRHSGFFHQRTLCQTLAGNSCDIISISERSSGVIESKNKPAIVITGRVHPGESNSSFMVQGFLDFITSEREEAIKLRKSFIFHVIPMLNPDGVIHGNYRCSLAATDLNRRYGAPHPSLHPTIFAKKSFLRATSQNRKILLYLDLHGHSKLKNAFLYGCDITLQSERIAKRVQSTLSADEIKQRRIFSRVFPKVLSAVSNATDSGYFSYKDCAFVIDRSKNGTGRVVGWRELHIAASYTIEASFCGNGDNRECKILKKASEPTSGVTGASKSATTANRVLKKSATNSALPLARIGSAHAGDNTAPGIAYDGGGAEPAPGNGSDVSDDEIEAEAADERKGSTKSKSAKLRGSKGSSKKGKLLRRCSTTPSLGRPHDASAGADSATALSDLLQQYDSLVHYRKEDLLNIGRDIGLSIFHFANLSHSSIENELEIATKADVEEKARQRRLQLMQTYAASPPRSTEGVGRKTMKEATVPRPASKSEDRTKLPIKASMAASSHAGHLQSAAAWAGLAESGGDDTSEVSSDVLDSDADLDGLDSLPVPLEEGQGDENADEGGAGNAGIAEQGLDLGEDSGEESGSESGGEVEEARSGRKGDAVSATDLAQLMREYAQSTVDLMESDMVARSHLRPGVFSASAIEQAMQEHPAEFLAPGSSEHVGLRMKCEYNIRRALKYANDITLTDAALKQHNAAYFSHNEEEAGSVDGSDSNPSVDNVPAAKMLKSVKKLKDTKHLVVELKKAAIRRKKKELELARKVEKKEAKKLAKQVSEAKRIAEEEAQAQAAQDAKDAAAFAAQQVAASAEAAAQSLREKASARRKSSIFQSAPKHAPLYRLAPDDVRAAPQLLPLKLVNFKDYDNAEAPHAHAGAHGVDPLIRPKSRSGDTGDHVALPMSSLTSAVNKLHFQPAEDAGVGNQPTAAQMPGVLAASNASALTRRNSLHHSFINPIAYQQTQPAGADATARDGSPRSAVRPTLHNMAPLLPASAVAGELSYRERERISAILQVDLADNAPAAAPADRTPTMRQRPKSGNATSRRRII